MKRVKMHCVAGIILMMAGITSSFAESNDSVMNHAPSIGFFSWGNTGIVSFAKQHVGKRSHQISGMTRRSLWCGEFVELARKNSDLSQVGSHRARDQRHGGTKIKTPVAGSLMVTSRHVDIVASVNPNGTVNLIRPNWTGLVQFEEAVHVPKYATFVIPE